MATESLKIKCCAADLSGSATPPEYKHAPSLVQLDQGFRVKGGKKPRRRAHLLLSGEGTRGLSVTRLQLGTDGAGSGYLPFKKPRSHTSRDR